MSPFHVPVVMAPTVTTLAEPAQVDRYAPMSTAVTFSQMTPLYTIQSPTAYVTMSDRICPPTDTM